MEIKLGDLSIFSGQNKAEQNGIERQYVDEIITSGKMRFEEEIKATGRRFESKQREWGKFVFDGIEIIRAADYI